MMKTLLRYLLTLLGANVLGYAAFLWAWRVVPGWWSAAARPLPFGWLLGLIAVTAIAFAAPPVIIGATAARVAGRHEPYVGLGSALWGLTAYRWWPAEQLPLPPESWVAPMSLILLSGLLAGWVVAHQSFSTRFDRNDA